MNIINPQLVQGTPEWLELRKTKITATDACVIMGASPWKTPLFLYLEKTGEVGPTKRTCAMQRGLDLEPSARELFTLTTGIHVEPKVVIKDWLMASLDGISAYGQIVEIKCAGKKDHALAIMGKIPIYYYPQLQHQMHVCDVDAMFYYSFDGVDGVVVNVEKDTNYVERMLEKEREFYKCITNRTPPKE